MLHCCWANNLRSIHGGGGGRFLFRRVSVRWGRVLRSLAFLIAPCRPRTAQPPATVSTPCHLAPGPRLRGHSPDRGTSTPLRRQIRGGGGTSASLQLPQSCPSFLIRCLGLASWAPPCLACPVSFPRSLILRLRGGSPSPPLLRAGAAEVLAYLPLPCPCLRSPPRKIRASSVASLPPVTQGPQVPISGLDISTELPAHGAPAE